MNRKGFTLVEVLIVVIILGILAAIGIPQFATSIEKAKGGEARAGLGHIQTAEKVYFAEYETYTTDTGALDITLTDRYWDFTIAGNGNIINSYIATATRNGGTADVLNTTITMDQNGTLAGTWPYLTN